MLRLALQNLRRRPLRTALTLSGLSVAVAVLACLTAFGQGYRRSLAAELDHMGVQLLLVPLGCPYDAAARVLKGKTLDNSLPDSAFVAAAGDPAVAVAAPMLLAAVPRPHAGRTDLWVGLDQRALSLKPWWRLKAGARWFADDHSVILGAEAAEVEMRAPGDKFYSPETGRSLRVVGVLERSGTSDDSMFFVPLRTAQEMFGQPGRLTAVAVRLRDPAQLREASERLQRIPGAQVVTFTEMMGAFLNLLGAVRALLTSIAVIAVAVGVLSIFNTLLASVVERAGELSTLRALGASRLQLFGLLTLESLVLTAGAGVAGLVLADLGGRLFEQIVRRFVPLAPDGSLLSLTATVTLESLAMAVVIGIVAGVYPAWQASRQPPALAAKLEAP